MNRMSSADRNALALIYQRCDRELIFLMAFQARKGQHSCPPWWDRSECFLFLGMRDVGCKSIVEFDALVHDTLVELCA